MFLYYYMCDVSKQGRLKGSYYMDVYIGELTTQQTVH